ncbi:MAG: helix-turn-helix domain-containing protein [Oscillospiraceae bacterium]|jgi:transcriptional regulator with XRE-family HTH domain|nr:helix-turn-helix domain-containing protein [Oscillospiraceae bacterium]
MLFGEKLAQLRKAKSLTQTKAAQALGVPFRTYQNYESCKIYPRNRSFYKTTAEFFEVPESYLVTDDDTYIADAYERGGSTSKRQIQTLLAEVGGLFAGGDLSEADKDKVMLTMSTLYWKAKENNRKYTSSARRAQADSANSILDDDEDDTLD